MQAAFRKNRDQGMIFGVCAGLSDRFGIETLWLRVGFVAATLLGFGLPLFAYIVIAVLAN